MNKKLILLAAIASLLVFILFKMKKKNSKNIINTKKDKPMSDYIKFVKNTDDGFVSPNEENIRAALKQIVAKYGSNIASIVEKMYRLETAHFKSAVFKHTNGAGVLYNKKYFSHRNYIEVYVKPLYKNGKHLKNVFAKEGDPDAKIYRYVVFPTILDGMTYLANYINKYGNKAPERWSGGAYNLAYLNKNIKTKFV